MDLLELQSLPLSARPLDVGPSGIGNEDVLVMAEAEFSEATMLAAIAANATRFDVSPRALVALKNAGVSERVIESMLAAETAKRQTAETAPPTPAPVTVAAAEQGTPADDAAAAPASMSPEAFAMLSEMIERLAAEQSPPAAPEAREPGGAEPHAANADPHSPRAWTAAGDERHALAPTIAEVAFTDTRGLGNGKLKTLQNLAGRALAFASPALGITSTLGGLFRSDDPERTAVWALVGGTTQRVLERDTVFEIEFGSIPGVNPDEYQPAIVRLVPTGDNYRLVAAAKTESDGRGLPSGPIVEEPVAARLTWIARGHYRVTSSVALPPGEYALVLRPIDNGRERGRRRNSETSLGGLLGGGTSQILYLTWDFSVRA